MRNVSTEICENWLSIFLRNPTYKQTNKQTNADENITSSAEVINQAFPKIGHIQISMK